MSDPTQPDRPLHCYTNGTDTVGAYDELDACMVIAEDWGENVEQNAADMARSDPFWRVADDARIAIHLDPTMPASECPCAAWTDRDVSPHNQHRRGCEAAWPEKTAAEWVAETGRAMICSTEV